MVKKIEFPPVQPGEPDPKAIDALIREHPWTYQLTKGANAGRILAMNVCYARVGLAPPYTSDCVLIIHLEQAPGDVPICTLHLMHGETHVDVLEGCAVSVVAGGAVHDFQAEIMPDDMHRALVINDAAKLIEIIKTNWPVSIILPVLASGMQCFTFLTHDLHWPPRAEDL